MNPEEIQEKEARPIEEIISAQILKEIDVNILKAQAEYENHIQSAMTRLNDFVITH